MASCQKNELRKIITKKPRTSTRNYTLKSYLGLVKNAWTHFLQYSIECLKYTPGQFFKK